MEVLAFAIRTIFVRLVFTCGVFLAAAVLAASLVTLFSRKHLRNAEHRGHVSVVRRWTAWIVLAVVSFAIPCIAALRHAIPFALESGLASGIESGVPEAVSSFTDFAGQSAMTVLGVTGDDALIDARALHERIRNVLATTSGVVGEDLSPVSMVDAVQHGFLTLLDGVLNGALDRDTRLTWRELVTKVREASSIAGSGAFAGIVTTLRITGIGHLLRAILDVLVLNVISVLVCYLLLRPKVAHTAVAAQT
jgi:hypothetical protein